LSKGIKLRPLLGLPSSTRVKDRLDEDDFRLSIQVAREFEDSANAKTRLAEEASELIVHKTKISCSLEKGFAR
jgi:hypothetical protein